MPAGPPGAWFAEPGAAPPPMALTALLQSVGEAVYVVDHEGRVGFANPAALAILGFDEAGLLGRPSHATIHHHRPDGTPFPEDECPLLRPRTTGETVRVEEDWFVRRDGSLVPVSYSSAPFPTGAGRGAVVVFRDETERREAEAVRRREAVERARADAVDASRARIVAAADDERRRLGRDLHDGAQQRLMNVALGVQQGIGDLERDPAAARRTLQDAVVEARATIAELRELVAGIHPSILTNRGLAAAVQSLTARSPLPVAVDVPDSRWSPRVEATAYFVIAEALANVAKHAGARRAEVEVREEDGGAERRGGSGGPDGGAERLDGPGPADARPGGDGRVLRIVVRDDGRGGAVARPGGGLQGLADRVEAVGGVLVVADDGPAGTVLTAHLPVGG